MGMDVSVYHQYNFQLDSQAQFNKVYQRSIKHRVVKIAGDWDTTGILFP